AGAVGYFHFFGFFKAHVGHLSDALGEGAAADGKHFGALHSPVIHERDVGGTAADVDEDGGKFGRILAAHRFGDGEGLGRDINEVQIQVAGHGLEGAEVHHGGEGVE